MKPGHSRILTDENVSPRVVAFFRANGYDVVDIKELGLFGLPDREVLGRAHAEQTMQTSACLPSTREFPLPQSFTSA